MPTSGIRSPLEPGRPHVAHQVGEGTGYLEGVGGVVLMGRLDHQLVRDREGGVRTKKSGGQAGRGGPSSSSSGRTTSLIISSICSVRSDTASAQ
ncbi:MAG: hypothetical protein JWO98_3559 [Frankiales bacterium]|nr:hypothetical protein [Frankiales bacterium]